MDHPFMYFLKEVRLFVHTPLVVHLGIAQLLARLLVRKGRNWLL
jgi:hypothetical protein